MRVGVDGTSWTNRRGYGRFVRNALTRLVELDRDARYVFYVGEETELPERAEARRVALSAPPDAGSTRPLGDLARLTLAARRDGADVFLFPSVYTYFPVPRVPTVVGVHDLIATELPELTLPSRRARLAWDMKQRLAVRRARVVFTVSEASRAALARRFGLPLERIAVVREAPDSAFRPRPEGEIAAARSRVGLDSDERFVVYAGGISPHKNLETLLEAFAGAADGGRLVLAGDLSDREFLSAGELIRRLVTASGLEDRVLLPGFVPDDALAALYTGAAAAVVPSLAEGFGLPAVEAAACGAPAILSDLPAHRESLADAALYFSPTDGRALRAHLEQALREEGLRSSLGERGRQAVAGLSWDAAARDLRDLVWKAAA